MKKVLTTIGIVAVLTLTGCSAMEGLTQGIADDTKGLSRSYRASVQRQRALREYEEQNGSEAARAYYRSRR